MESRGYSKTCTVEEVNGVRKEVTTEVRTLGDQTVTTKTVVDSDGKETVTTDFKNIDEKDLPDFNQRWDTKPALTSSHPHHALI